MDTCQAGRTTRFGSIALSAGWRRRLLPPLDAAHADSPFTPRDPRDGLRRATDVIRPLGLEVVTIRGSVAVGGVEVDHVWLAVTDGSGDPWVLDPSFPLHDGAFTALLPGYVAGDVSLAELHEVAARATLADRVVGTFPPSARYRGRPVWGARR